MTPRLPLLLLTVPAFVLPLGAQAPTADDAVALIREAVAYTKAHGQAAALREFTIPSGKFRRFGGELYITVYDLNGKCLAHGQEPAKVGVEALHSKDPDGRPFIQERIQVARAKGKGWQDIRYRDPRTGHAAPKAMYFELHDGLVFGTGIYKS
jgi:signal transduction histidine kinase